MWRVGDIPRSPTGGSPENLAGHRVIIFDTNRCNPALAVWPRRMSWLRVDTSHRLGGRAGSIRGRELRHIKQRRLHRCSSRSSLCEADSGQIFRRVHHCRPGVPSQRARTAAGASVVAQGAGAPSGRPRGRPTTQFSSSGRDTPFSIVPRTAQCGRGSGRISLLGARRPSGPPRWRPACAVACRRRTTFSAMQV